jgi:hypothetical protein
MSSEAAFLNAHTLAMANAVAALVNDILNI